MGHTIMTHMFVLGAVLYILIYRVDENVDSKCNQLYEKTNVGCMIEYRFIISLRKHRHGSILTR